MEVPSSDGRRIETKSPEEMNLPGFFISVFKRFISLLHS